MLSPRLQRRLENIKSLNWNDGKCFSFSLVRNVDGPVILLFVVRMQKGVTDISMMFADTLVSFILAYFFYCNFRPSRNETHRERNRQHAKKSRLRKKGLTSVLEDNLKELKAENERMREQLYQVMGEDKLQQMLESRTQRAHEQFIEALKQPNVRVLDDKSKARLKMLSKKKNSFFKTSGTTLESLLSSEPDDNS